MGFKTFVKSNKIELVSLLVAFIFYASYIYTYYFTEVLFLASFMGDIQLVSKYFDGTLDFNDLFSKFGEHGMFGYNCLLLINASVLHYTVYFDMILNGINVFLVALFIIISVSNSIEKKNLLYFFALLIIIFYLFNVMQGGSATMETQVRLGLLFFVCSSYFINKSLLSNKIDKYLYISILLIIITINIFGTMYNFAGYPVIFLVVVFLMLKSKNKHLNARYIFIVYSIALIAYFFEYGIIGAGNANKKSIIEGMLFWLERPIEFIHGIAIYYGSATLGYATFADKVISTTNYLYIGYVILSINIIATVLYFNSRMYQKTYLPIFLQSYTFFVIILVLIGRYSLDDWLWGSNTWYQVHTKVGLVSAIWIILYATNITNNSFTNKIKLFSFILFFILFIGLMFGTYNELKRAPYVKIWYQNIQKCMFVDAKDMPINPDGMTPLMVDEKTTEFGLNVLKKYKLSVFKNILYTAILDKNTKLLDGELYSDNWVGPNLKMYMKTGGGKLHIDLYLPNEHFSPNSLTIFIDGVSIGTQFIKEVGTHHLEFKTLPNKNVILKAVFGRSIIPKELGIGEDQRELSAIVNRFEFE